MVYYLRPATTTKYSMSPKKSRVHYSLSSMTEPSYRISPNGSASLVPGLSAVPSEEGTSEDDSLQHITAYLVIAVLVTAVTAVIIRFVVKPDANCVKFLTEDDGQGGVKLSPLKVTGASLATGVIVAGLTFMAHKISLL